MNGNTTNKITRKFTIEIINYINAFEKITKTRARDCIIDDDGLMFIIDSVYVGRAIGAKGKNIKYIEARFKKKIRIIEFDNNAEKFVKNLIFPVKAREIRLAGNKIEIVAGDARVKGRLIGRDRKNLNRLQRLVSRYFNYNIEIL